MNEIAYEYLVFYREKYVRKFSSENSAKNFMNEMVELGFDAEVYAKEKNGVRLFLIAKRSGNNAK